MGIVFIAPCAICKQTGALDETCTCRACKRREILRAIYCRPQLKMMVPDVPTEAQAFKIFAYYAEEILLREQLKGLYDNVKICVD